MQLTLRAAHLVQPIPCRSPGAQRVEFAAHRRAAFFYADHLCTAHPVHMCTMSCTKWAANKRAAYKKVARKVSCKWLAAQDELHKRWKAHKRTAHKQVAHCSAHLVQFTLSAAYFCADHLCAAHLLCSRGAALVFYKVWASPDGPTLIFYEIRTDPGGQPFELKAEQSKRPAAHEWTWRLLGATLDFLDATCELLGGTLEPLPAF